MDDDLLFIPEIFRRTPDGVKRRARVAATKFVLPKRERAPRGYERASVRLMDELPRLGCGRREVWFKLLGVRGRRARVWCEGSFAVCTREVWDSIKEEQS